MKQVCLSDNIVLIFDRNLYDDFSTDKIEELIKNAYRNEDPEIGSASFPNEMKSVFSTSVDIQVLGTQKQLVITHSKINESNEIDSDFVRLAFNIKDLFIQKGLSVQHYGYNFTFALQDEEYSTIRDKIKSKYFRANIVPNNSEFVFALPTLAYNKDSTRYTLKYDVVRDDNNEPIKINFVSNVHFQNSQPDDEVTNFIESYRKSYRDMYNFVGSTV